MPTKTKKKRPQSWHFEHYEMRKIRLMNALLNTAFHEFEWTQKRLASESGVSIRTISRWATGYTRFPRLDTIDKLCQAVGIPLETALDLMG